MILLSFVFQALLFLTLYSFIWAISNNICMEERRRYFTKKSFIDDAQRISHTQSDNFMWSQRKLERFVEKFYTHISICRHSHLHLLLLKWFYALKCYLFIPQAAEIKFLQKLFFFYCREWKQTREWWRERTKKNMKNQMEKFFLSDVSWKENWRQLRRKKIYIL